MSDLHPNESESQTTTLDDGTECNDEPKKRNQEGGKKGKRDDRLLRRANHEKEREDNFDHIRSGIEQWYLFLHGCASPFIRSFCLLLLFIFLVALIPGYTWCIVGKLNDSPSARIVFDGIQVLSGLASIGVGVWGISLAKESSRDFAMFKREVLHTFSTLAKDPEGAVRDDEK